MAAAAMTTGVIQKRDVTSTVVSGSTERRLYEGWCEATKVTAGDWVALTAFGLTTSQTAGFSHAKCYLRDTNRICSEEKEIIYNQDNGRIILGGATASAATAYLQVWWYQ